MPSFCALMANYNDAPTLEAALIPLIEQTVPFDRILVINDGSTDNSMEVLARLKSRAPQLEILDNGRNIGVAASVRRGLEHITEDYVFPASANDIFSHHLVEHALAALKLMPNASMVAGKLGLKDLQGDEQIMSLPFPGDSISIVEPDRYKELVRSHPFSAIGGATFVNRGMMSAFGGYREEMKWMTDWFLFALLAAHHGFVYVPEKFGTMILTQNQYSCAAQDWSKQGPVIQNFFKIMQSEFPKAFEDFRAMALLPSYDWQILPMLLANPKLRSFITPLLLWRLGVSKLARSVARVILPRRVFNPLRKWARV